MRFLPIPFQLVNAAAAVVGVRFAKFFVASAIGMLPPTAILTYFASALLAAANECELVPGELVVCIDVAHRGLGTASCGPDVLDGYRVRSGRYEFAYRIGARELP